MILNFRNRHFFVIDVLLLLLTPVIALSLRANLPWGQEYGQALLLYTAIALLVKLPVFYRFQFYQRFWPYASIDAMLSISIGVFVSTVALTGITYIVYGIGVLPGAGLPRSVPLIDGLLTLLVVAGSRFTVRTSEYYKTRMKKHGSVKRVLIAGAGDAGQIVAREIYASQHVAMALVGFVDDNPAKIGAMIHGVRVLGPLAEIPKFIKEYRVQEVIIAMPTATGSVIRQVVQSCEITGVTSKILPGMYELLSGEVNYSRLRNVEVEDLLRRDIVQIDATKVGQLLSGKRVMVTGAGGSIGSELCTQILKCQPAQLISVGHGENSLYTLEKRLDKAGFRDQTFEMIVADVRDRPRLAAIFERFRPEIVFHTAAHKHVPLMEANIEDAVTNNVLGTRNAVELARDFGVGRFVLISTDKAVNPFSVMGMTKRLAELIVGQVAAETRRPYVVVRFGNVLGSRGSVIPLFKRQIAAGGPVTVTDPNMVRFFMTIPEAVQLVLQSSALGENGEVFVLDMGEPVKIVDLARDMIELSGYQVGEDIKIEFTGLRPGERLHEDLFAVGEKPVQTEHRMIFVTCNSDKPAPAGFEAEITTLINLAHHGDTDRLRAKLAELATN